MEALFGIVGADFVVLAADKVAARSIVAMKSTEEKFRSLNSHTVLAYSGEAGDAVRFAELVQRNVQLHTMRTDMELGPKECANYTRRILADSLRSRSPYQTNVLVAGVESKPTEKPVAAESSEGPKLFWIDHLATLVEIPFAAHGYAAHFCLSLLDRHWRPNMTLPEVLELLKMCLQELKTRFIVNLPELGIRVIRPSGIEQSNL